MNDFILIQIVSAFLFGIASFLSPCNFALIPSYIAYLSGEASGNNGKSLVPNSMLFVLGFMLVFFIIGGTASALSQFLLINKEVLRVVSGVFITCIGLFFLTHFFEKFLKRDFHFSLPDRFQKYTHLRAFLLGVLLAFGWSPCYGPLIGAVFTLTLASETFFIGLMLFVIYSLGFSLPFLAIALLFDRRHLYLNRIKPYLRLFHILSGLILVLIGVIILLGRLEVFSTIMYDLFDTFNIPYTS